MVTIREKTLVGALLLVIGLLLLVFSFFKAYTAYQNYQPVMPKVSGDLATAVSSASFELINLAAKLAFVGIMVWAGSIILKYGVDLFRSPGDKKQEAK